MSFTAPKFTGVGRQLQTRVIAGDTLTFTTIKLGDGTMTTEPIAALTDLIHGIITLPVHEVRRNADYADVTGVFQNAGLSSGFYWREIGIFAADPDYPNDRSHDILYCYQNAAELAEYIPSASSAVIEKIIRVACVVGDAESVTVGLASQAYAKAEDLQALEEQHSKDVERINDALDAVDPTKVTAKAEPADGDSVMIADSADGGKAKRLLWLNVKAALGKLFVPLARKINGKALTKNVTLTAADIKMPNSEEDVGAAMAKRPLKQYPKTLDVHKITIGQLYWCDADTANTPYKAGLTDYTQGIALCTAGSAEEKWCSIIYIVHAGKGVWFQSSDQAGWKNWVQLAKCECPDVHSLPLASGFPVQSYANTYYKTQEGIVHLNFCIFRGESTAFVERETICTMPEGYRPSTVIAAAVGGDGKSFGNGLPAAELHIEPDGRMWFYGADTRINWVYGEIAFLAAS